MTSVTAQVAANAVAQIMADGREHVIMGVPFRWEGNTFINLGATDALRADTEQGLPQHFTVEELGVFIYNNRTNFVNLRVRR